MIRRILFRNVRIIDSENRIHNYKMLVIKLRYIDTDHLELIDFTNYSKEVEGVEYFGTDIILKNRGSNLYEIAK